MREREARRYNQRTTRTEGTAHIHNGRGAGRVGFGCFTDVHGALSRIGLVCLSGAGLALRKAQREGEL